MERLGKPRHRRAGREAERAGGNELISYYQKGNRKRCFPPSFNYGAAGDFARYDKKMKLGKLHFFAVSFAFRSFLSA
jgi:hypothetical protein